MKPLTKKTNWICQPFSLKPKLCRGNSRFITKSHNWVDLTHLPRLRPPNMQTWGPNPLASIWRCDMLWLYTVDGQFSACLDLWNGMKTLQTTGKKTWITLHTNRQWRFKTPDFVHSSAERTFNSKDSKVQIGPAVRNHAIREVGVTHQHQCSCTITVRTSAGQWNNRLAPMFHRSKKNHLVSKLKALIAFFGGWKIVWTTWRLGVVTNGIEKNWRAFCGRKWTTQNLIHSFVFWML